LHEGKTENGMGTGGTRVNRRRVRLTNATPVIQGSEEIFDVVDNNLSEAG
jgi:hypothetical protein